MPEPMDYLSQIYTCIANDRLKKMVRTARKIETPFIFYFFCKITGKFIEGVKFVRSAADNTLTGTPFSAGGLLLLQGEWF
jgi:hypothetical protein